MLCIGKTVATVNATEQKLQEFKQDMAEGRPPRRHHHDVQGTGQAVNSFLQLHEDAVDASVVRALKMGNPISWVLGSF